MYAADDFYGRIIDFLDRLNENIILLKNLYENEKKQTERIGRAYKEIKSGLDAIKALLKEGLYICFSE